MLFSLLPVFQSARLASEQVLLKQMLRQL